MFERAVIALILVALLAAVVWAGRRWYARRNEHIEASIRSQHVAPAIRGPVAPRVVYFNTTTCVICKSQQEPAIDSLSARMPDLVVEQYDAVECGQIATEYGVLSVPTIAVYDRTGDLVTINRGYTSASALFAQLEGFEPPFADDSTLATGPASSPVSGN